MTEPMKRDQSDRDEGFRRELQRLINRHSMENGSNTPDFILAEFLDWCLRVLDRAIEQRDKWYHDGRVHHPTKGLAEPKASNGTSTTDPDDENCTICHTRLAWRECAKGIRELRTIARAHCLNGDNIGLTAASMADTMESV